MITLITYFKALNIYSHIAHNLCKGPSFFEDHEFFGDLYGFADASYDEMVEKFIGTQSDSIDLLGINKNAVDALKGMDSNYLKNCLDMCLEINKELQAFKIEDGGVMNMIQDKQDKLQVFIYKMKRRIA